MQIVKSIQNRIHEIRGERVMLDFDLAQLYEVVTKVLNQAVRRVLHSDLRIQLNAIKERLGDHDAQLNQIY